MRNILLLFHPLVIFRKVMEPLKRIGTSKGIAFLFFIKQGVNLRGVSFPRYTVITHKHTVSSLIRHTPPILTSYSSSSSSNSSLRLKISPSVSSMFVSQSSTCSRRSLPFSSSSILIESR